jgi:hypothetical protein
MCSFRGNINVGFLNLISSNIGYNTNGPNMRIMPILISNASAQNKMVPIPGVRFNKIPAIKNVSKWMTPVMFEFS